jgi:two-component sensor histidine kinase
MQLASQMALEILEVRVAAQELLDRARGGSTLPGRPALEPDARARADSSPAEARLVRARADLEHLLDQCLASIAANTGDRAAPPPQESESGEAAEWLELLALQERRLEELLAGFQGRLRVDPGAARLFFERQLDPFLETELLPAVYAVRNQAEEELADAVRNLSSPAGATARLLLATSVTAVGLALLLGFLVWRSVSRPIRSLQRAAQEIGRGRLDTRVDVHGRDELGILGSAFNTMAEKLATSTVSVSNLEAVQDKLQRSLAEKELLLREVHHRVKNNFQVISSLLDLQSRAIREPRLLDEFEESQNRIRTMALIHEQIYGAGELDRIDIRSYLERLVSQLVQSFGRGAWCGCGWTRRNSCSTSTARSPAA